MIIIRFAHKTGMGTVFAGASPFPPTAANKSLFFRAHIGY